MVRKISVFHRLVRYGGTVIGLLLTSSVVANGPPGDTYFSVAVSENSHNHYGDNLLFLDFVEQAHMAPPPRTVLAPRLAPGSVQLDGKADEWNVELLSLVKSRVMNNYPLSEHFDATPTPLLVGSGFDDEYIYFLLQWEDANHDASVNRNRWVYSGSQWLQQEHLPVKAGTPAAAAINRDDKLAGREDEDQVFMMFPIVDRQGNFRDGAMGCGGYCHVSLMVTADPRQAHIGDGASAMHSGVVDDIADLWHWTATRSRPMNTLLDGYIDYGEESYNGRKPDAGTHPFEDNSVADDFRPKYLHKGDYQAGRYQQPGFVTRSLSREDLQLITPDMVFAEGVSLPFYIGVPATGSRADVATAASFDPESNRWTLEIRRKRVTGDKRDRQFVAGTNARPPSAAAMLQFGDVVRGEKLFRDKACAACHGDKGEGRFEGDKWLYPRNQRVSGPSIRNTVSLHRPKRLQYLAIELNKWGEEPAEALMPFVNLTAQEAEDIAAWLQQQFIPRGE